MVTILSISITQCSIQSLCYYQRNKMIQIEAQSISTLKP
jgi:hypothetical protein